MIAIAFLGLGLAAIACGLSGSTQSLWAGLCLLGAFASVYHPVGIPWLVRNTESRGKALGINGIFGSSGVAAAGLVAGLLMDVSGWRAAFIVPGCLSLATGLGMVCCLKMGLMVDRTSTKSVVKATSQVDRIWTFGILLLTMFSGAVIYQATQASLPKVFELRLAEDIGERALGIGAMVAIVYGTAGLSQVVAGYLADRYPLKVVYLAAFMFQIPLLWLMSELGGMVLVAVAAAATILNSGALPAENMLLADTVPVSHHGLAFGLKFVLAFGSAPIAIRLVSYINSTTGDFRYLFLVLAGMAILSCLSALMLPTSRSSPKELASNQSEA